MKFRKKPVVIEAFRYMLDTAPKWFQDALNAGAVKINGTSVTIKTLEGDMTANIGHWIIQGVNGELYPCKPDIFAKTYDRMPTIGELADGEY